MKLFPFTASDQFIYYKQKRQEQLQQKDIASVIISLIKKYQAR